MQRRKYFIIYRLLPFIFLLFLLFPYVNDYFNLFPKVNNFENRVLAKKPVLDLNKLDLFPKEYELYFNDHFSFRNNYNKVIKQNKYLLGANPLQDKIIIGKHDWMFFNNNMLPNNRKKNLFTNDELKKLKAELTSRNFFFEKHNCKYFFVVIPTKAIVYQDSLPEYYHRVSFSSVQTCTNQLINYMKGSGLSIINLDSVLRKKKNEKQIFLKYDHHWNQLGAFYACKFILDNLNSNFGLKVNNKLCLNDYNIEYKETQLGVLASMLGLSEYFTDLEPWLTPANNLQYVKALPKVGYKKPQKFAFANEFELRFSSDSVNLLKCMVIRDSFAQYYTQFLSRGFNETLFIWDNWQYKINKDIFLEEKPDIFITMILDKHLRKIIQNREF